MEIEKSSRQLMLVFAWLALAGVIGRLDAQQAPPANSLTVERIVEDRERDKSQPKNQAWSPGGKSLGFIRTAPRVPKIAHGPSTAPTPLPPSEIWSIDTADGKEKLIVSKSELTAAFGKEPPSLASDEEYEAAAKRRQLSGFAWAPDGRHLLLEASISLVWFDLDAHASRTLVSNGKELATPEISPDGRTVSYIQDHTLWLVNVATGAARTLTPAGSGDLLQGEPDWPYLHELGLHSAFWWSPDSSAIAWLETDDRAVDKYSLRTADGEEQQIAYPKPGGAIPKVHLMVRPILGGKTTQIDLGGDADMYIPRVQWLPDGKHLAVERLSRSQKVLDLLLTDPARGKTQVILTEKDAYWINLNNDLHFFKDSRRFVWASERSGYRHLYLYDTSGRQLAQLTRGNWEVASLADVDETTGVVYFSATEASPLERQLYRVSLDGSGFTRITQEKGTHDVMFSRAGDVFLDIWSDHATRPRQSLHHADGAKIGGTGDSRPEEVSAPLPNTFEFLTIKTHQSIDLNAWMMKPPDFDPGRRYPVIFYVAGGPGEQIVRDSWGGDIDLWFSMMAQKGYIVFALDNRGTAGRGHLFEEPVHLRFSGSEMADVRDGVLYLHSKSWIDTARIGICGWGYGGFLALHGMLDRPLMYKAGFAGSPVTDWHLYDAVFGERYLEDPVRDQDGWLASSPVENAKNLNAPLLLAQATLDEKIHLENSLMLLDELLDNGKYADILLFSDRHDLFEDRKARQIMFERLTEFFMKNL
jgi:dipeptidyl-peptidase-4